MAIKNTCLSRAWYRAYCAAMLETDANKIFAGVECARKAIQERTQELSPNLSTTHHESKELERAMHFLTMLLDCSRVDEGQSSILLTKDAFRTVPRAMASAAQ